MKADLIRIGNSKGIRIPKALIEQCGFEDSVELRVDGNSLILTPAHSPRQGWEAAFKAMAEAGDDKPLLPDDLKHGWAETEWEW